MGKDDTMIGTGHAAADMTSNGGFGHLPTPPEAPALITDVVKRLAITSSVWGETSTRAEVAAGGMPRPLEAHTLTSKVGATAAVEKAAASKAAAEKAAAMKTAAEKTAAQKAAAEMAAAVHAAASKVAAEARQQLADKDKVAQSLLTNLTKSPKPHEVANIDVALEATE